MSVDTKRTKGSTNKEGHTQKIVQYFYFIEKVDKPLTLNQKQNNIQKENKKKKKQREQDNKRENQTKEKITN